ncbi:MAG TPA: zinc ABC transporter substrate-binding protein [Lentimicrobium sp.]|nr:zinc ABC transporter substrate-binding protein [Lentimicrobium sp.]
MRKLLPILLVIFISSCQQGSKTGGDKVTVTVSILPQKYIIERIAGDAVNVMVLVPDGSGPETYEPTARQMQELNISKICFITGLLDFEKSWIPKVSEIYPSLKVVNLSDGLNLIKGEEEHAESHEGHHHGGIDPHIWLSIKEIKIQSKAVLTSMQTLMPEQKDKFNANYNTLISYLDSVDNIINKKISGNAGNISYMIYHPSLTYFSRDYGIEQIPIELEGKEPSPAYMRELIDIAGKKQITTIFYSQQFDKKSAETIANQLHIGLTKFNPLEYDVPANLMDFTDKLVNSTNK